MVKLPHIVERDLCLGQTGQLLPNRSILTQVAQQPIAQALAGHPAQLFLDRDQNLADIRTT